MQINSLKTSAAASLQLNSLRIGLTSKTLMGLFLSNLGRSIPTDIIARYYKKAFNLNIKMNHNIGLTEFPNLLQHDKLLVKMPPLSALRAELQQALRFLTDHSLTNSAKWIGELLMGITTDADIQDSFLIKSFIHSNTDPQREYRPATGIREPALQNLLLLAKNLFELREYKKCSHLLKDYRSQFPRNQSLIFYYHYSLWMSGLIRKQQEIYENEGSSRPPQHAEIHNLERELKQLYSEGNLHGINLYLYGLVLREQQRVKEARKVLIECLNEFPYLWSAWIELCKIIESEDMGAITKELNDHWLKNFYFSSFCLEKYRNDMSIELNYGILCFFKRSNYVMNQIAHSFYNNQEFDISLEWFQKLLELDPFRFQNMDTYSNILYIKENQGQLANLALKEFYNNKYNPETCCVIGNYYSLMGEHLKAIVYFRKALKLDRTCLAAWTLMGHEYLEMKNIPGAIEAYRNAVEIDPKDFRAWYGLGQTYELQNMNNYALYYYSRAVLSRPKDSRMWNAMGCCYDKMGKSNEAQRCYVRAENSKDREGIAIHQMGKLYHAMGPAYEQKAVNAFELNLRRKEEEMLNDKELGECLLYLSRYYKKVGQIDKAIDLARRLSDLQGVEKDEANKLLQQLNLVS